MSRPLETDCLKGVRRVGQIVGPFSSHGSWAICIRSLWTAHVHFCKIRRSFSPVASAGDCAQLTTLLLLAHTACPQQDCPLFVRHSKIVHATCDVVRGLWSLPEGSVRRDRRWNANGGSVGQFLNKRDRWVERRRRSSAKSSIMIIIWKSFVVFLKMCGLPLHLRIVEMFRWVDPSCSSPSCLPQYDLHWSPGHVNLSARREIKLSCQPSPLALLDRNVYLSFMCLRKFGFLSRRSSCSDRLLSIFLPHISAIRMLQLL